MSNALARLRASVGDPLFERTRHGIEPTRRALAMAEPVGAAIASLQQALSGFVGSSTTVPALSVVADAYAEWLLLPAVVGAMQAAPFPFSLDIHRRSPVPSSNVALTIDWRDLGATRVGDQSVLVLRDSLVCIVRRGNRSVGDRFPLQSFLDAGHVAIQSDWNRRIDVIDGALARRGEKRRVLVAVADFVSAAWLVSRTDLVAIVPRRLGELLAPPLELGILSVPFDVTDLALEISWSRENSDDPVAMWVKRRILEAGRQLAESQKT